MYTWILPLFYIVKIKLTLKDLSFFWSCNNYLAAPKWFLSVKVLKLDFFIFLLYIYLKQIIIICYYYFFVHATRV